MVVADGSILLDLFRSKLDPNVFTSEHNIFKDAAYPYFSIILSDGRITIIVETLYWGVRERERGRDKINQDYCTCPFTGTTLKTDDKSRLNGRRLGDIEVFLIVTGTNVFCRHRRV